MLKCDKSQERRFNMLAHGYLLLKDEFEKCMAEVNEQPQWSAYAREKWRHSMQVMGAGNYLVRRVQWLQDKSDKYIDMVKTAILLHDVCRFAEISARFRENIQSFNHGAVAAEFLQKIPEFNDVRIWLPIRHHGHLIEELYADKEYQNIKDKNLQEEVERICFIIRDADKIANLRMMAYEPDVLPLFLGKNKYVPQEDGVISDLVRRNAFGKTTIPRDPRSTIADRLAAYLSWFRDINYQYAIDFCKKLDVISGLYKLFKHYCADDDFQQQYIACIQNYLDSHEFLR